MSLVLTYWEDPINKRTPDDFEGIKTIVLKTVKQIPELVSIRLHNCTMISVERSCERTRKDGTKTKDFKEVWRKGQSESTCPFAGIPGMNLYFTRKELETILHGISLIPIANLPTGTHIERKCIIALQIMGEKQ